MIPGLLLPELAFSVYGLPITQGSKKGYNQGGRVQIVDANAPKLKPWRAQVTAAAKEAATRYPLFTGALIVGLRFDLFKPPPVTREYPHVRGTGDIDKLVRSILDSLTDAGIYADDAAVTDLGPCSKRYGRPGVHITVNQQVPGQ